MTDTVEELAQLMFPFPTGWSKVNEWERALYRGRAKYVLEHLSELGFAQRTIETGENADLDAMAAIAWRAHYIAEWGDDLDPMDTGEGRTYPMREALIAAGVPALLARVRTAEAERDDYRSRLQTAEENWELWQHEAQSRTVETAEELNALPLGSVVVDFADVARTKRAGNSYMGPGWTAAGNAPLRAAELANGRPMRVVHTPAPRHPVPRTPEE